MRGTAAGFQTPPVLTDHRTASLPAADLGGLLLLWAHAWAAGGFLPAGDGQLAILSRLGEAWQNSALRSNLIAFFVPDGSGLRSVDLAPQIEHRERVRKGRRRGGLASAVARASKCSANVQQMLNICSDQDKEAGGAASLVSTEVQPAEEVAATPGTLECTVFAPAAAGQIVRREDELTVPPHTPLYREYSSSRVDGGVGEGGGQENTPPLPPISEAPPAPPPAPPPETSQDAPGQLSLFGDPIAPPRPRGRPRTGKPTAQQQEEASAIVDAYMDEVRTEHRRVPSADRQVAAWIADGVRGEDLRAATRNYARDCDRTNRDPMYRSAPHNFFSRAKATWRGYLKGTTDESKVRTGTGNAGPVHRVRSETSYDGLTIVLPETPASPAPIPQVSDAGGTEDGPNPFLAAARDRIAGPG